MTTNERHRARGSRRLAAERKTRSDEVQLGPRELAVQYGELVAEHNDLELFELIRAESQRRELQYASKH